MWAFQLIFLTYKTTKSPIVFAETYCESAAKSHASQQRHSAAHDSHKQIFLLSVLRVNVFHQE